MKEYKKGKELFQDILTIKKNIRLLDGQELIDSKIEFYKIPLSPDVLDWFWRFIWDDMNYEELKSALHLV